MVAVRHLVQSLPCLKYPICAEQGTRRCRNVLKGTRGGKYTSSTTKDDCDVFDDVPRVARHIILHMDESSIRGAFHQALFGLVLTLILAKWEFLGNSDAVLEEQTWIVRFREYMPYDESRVAVEGLVRRAPESRAKRQPSSRADGLGDAFTSLWTSPPPDLCGMLRFIERDNPVSRENMPTDFAVVAAPGHVRGEDVLACLGGRGSGHADGRGDLRPSFVKDVWPDAEIRGRRLQVHGEEGDEGDAAEEEEAGVANGVEGAAAGKRRPGRLQTRWPYELGAEMARDRELDARDAVGNVSSSHARHLSKRDSTYTLLVDRLSPQKIWEEGFSGQGIRMGIFDTGIKEHHPDVDHIEERSNWTHEKTLSDGLGHGSFVAGVIAGHHPDCPGLAPGVAIHTFKVFTNDQVSFTSWFLDAFNYAIATKIDIVNLSIGGPDYLDIPFVEKVTEATSSGMVMTSAIGNDGPTYGTMNNPADQSDVIGVGGISYSDLMAGFSSRGMTTWELPLGYGRAKPDVVTYGSSVRGAAIPGGCRTLSGTSVSSPVAAGALCLLASTIPEEKRKDVLNPAAMKQILIEGADMVLGANMFEQGQGAMNIGRSYEVLKAYAPRASLVPAKLDLTSCPYAWPFCKQPLYANAMPTMFNATLLNGMGVDGKITQVSWTPSPGNAAAEMADVRFEHSNQIWPWSGYVALFIRVRPEAKDFKGVAEGTVTVDVESPPHLGEPADRPRRSTASMQVKFEIIPTPPREARILWDQFHSVKYPPAYLPRDDLQNNMDILDWHGDHPHTNFHKFYDTLRHDGYYLEILGSPLTCFDAEQYGTLLIVDSEEEFYAEEVAKLETDVKEKGMGLAIFADWYDADTIRDMRFYDDNTRTWWEAVTGGAHIPALNDLLRPFDAAFAGGAHKVSIHAPDGTNFDMASGSALAAMPAGSHVLFAKGKGSPKTSSGGKRVPEDIPVIGLASVGHGRIALYGDSNCLDAAYRRSSCESFAMSLIRYLNQVDNTMLQGMALQEESFGSLDGLPERVAGVDYSTVSRVLSTPLTCYSNSNAGIVFDQVIEDDRQTDVPPPLPEINDVFDRNLVQLKPKDTEVEVGFVTKELALASVAFLLLLLLGCARWKRRVRRRRPASTERLPILTETRAAGLR